MRKHFQLAFTLIFTVSFIAACGDDNEANTDLPQQQADAGNREASAPTSLTKDVLPIVVAQCGHCHVRSGGPSAKAIVNGAYFETKDDLLGRIGSAIVAGDSASSALIKIMKQEMEVGEGPNVMPPPASKRPKMPDTDVAVVAKWIDEGALDN